MTLRCCWGKLVEGTENFKNIQFGKMCEDRTRKFWPSPKNLAVYLDDLVAVDQEKFNLDCGVSKHFNNHKIDVSVTRSIKALRSQQTHFNLNKLIWCSIMSQFHLFKKETKKSNEEIKVIKLIFFSLADF